MCYVLLPDNLSRAELLDPVKILSKISICETLLTRTVPSRERDQDTERNRDKTFDKTKSKSKS